MKLILATAYDSNYPWGAAWEASARQHHADVVVFDLVTTAGQRTTRQPGHVVLPQPSEAKNGCPQHGAFLAAGNFEPDYVIAFGDGDMVMQRPFTAAEREYLDVPAGVILAGENQPGRHTLADEANLLRAKAEGWVVDELFPGWRELPIHNTGLVVARAATWQRLYDCTRGLLPVGFACFSHYATQQWVISYAIGRWFEHRDLPRTIHCHGLAGPVAGMAEDEGGAVYWQGEKVVFRHAINLTPPKAVVGLPKLNIQPLK